MGQASVLPGVVKHEQYEEESETQKGQRGGHVYRGGEIHISFRSCFFRSFEASLLPHNRDDHERA